MGVAARSAGFHFLDDGPAVVNGVGFVGNVGWFDYGFRKPELGIPLRYYQAKVSPVRRRCSSSTRSCLPATTPTRPATVAGHPLPAGWTASA